MQLAPVSFGVFLLSHLPLLEETKRTLLDALNENLRHPN